MARRSPALQRVYDEYIKYIADSIVKSDEPGIGVSYLTREDNWMEKVPLSNKMEQFLINNTKIFLNTMDMGNSLSTDPNFLKLLVKEIVKYLAPYFAKNNTRLTVANASIFLHNELWEKNWHIRGMLAYQAEKREKKRQAQIVRRARNARKAKKEKAAKDFETFCEIRIEVINTNQKRKKK